MSGSFLNKKGWLRRLSGRKKAHELIDAPPEFSEQIAPELPVLPDEYNRFAPLASEADEAAAAALRRRMRKMLLLAAAGLMTAGLLLTGVVQLPQSPEKDAAAVESPSPSPTPKGGKPKPAATGDEQSDNEPEATPELTDAPTEAPTATPTATPTPSPTPTPEPTPEPDIPGVQLLEAEWYAGAGEAAQFRVVMRIPKKNVDNGIIISDIYARINSNVLSHEEWDAIWTLSDEMIKTEVNENGDQIITYAGSLYWPRSAPTSADKVTLAATGWDTRREGAMGETELSNTLTVGFGQTASLFDQPNE